MNLAEIRNAGGFIQGQPERVPVKWREYEFDVFVKRLSFGDVERLFNGEDDRSRSAAMIAACVLMGENKEPISYNDAYQLEVTLATKLIEAVNQVNGTGGNQSPN